MFTFRDRIKGQSGRGGESLGVQSRQDSFSLAASAVITLIILIAGEDGDKNIHIISWYLPLTLFGMTCSFSRFVSWGGGGG